MKTYFLHKNSQSKKLIIFASGFASHYSHFCHLKSKENVLMLYDYSELDLNLEFKDFDEITLIAFSMGVCVSARFLKHINFTQKIAINGTNYGIEDDLGIKKELFLKQCKDSSLVGFKKALFAKNLDKAKNFYFNDEDYLKNELTSLYNLCNKQAIGLKFDKALLSKKDLVFSTKASENFFNKENTKIIYTKEPHFVFFAFETWEDICNI